MTSVARAAGALEGELRRVLAVRDPQAVEHLRREQEVRREPLEVPPIVAGRKCPDLREHAIDRHSLDRDDPASYEAAIDGIDDVEAVRELVEAKRVQAQLPRVIRVAGKEPRVAVARAEERDDPQHADEELVLGDGGRTLRERVHLGRETLARDRPVRVGVDHLEGVAELADVAHCVERGGRPGVRPRGKHDHGAQNEEQARHPHLPG